MIKNIFNRMIIMKPEAWYIFINSVKLSCLLCLCSFALLKESNGNMMYNFTLYMTAISLIETTQAILILGVIGSVCVEAAQS